MDPKHTPSELADLTVVEQQLICRISPCINVHMLGHGGIASGGHCVTFPQEVNEPAKIFPRLPEEINVIRVRKQGKNGTSKDFVVRRLKIQTALLFLKQYNPAYFDIIISKERLAALPIDGELSDIQTVEYQANTVHISDNGPAPDQTDPVEIEGNTHSCVILPDPHINIRKKVEDIVSDVVGQAHGDVTINKKGTITLPWPTRENIPVSEFTTHHFFTLAFPCLFPYGTGDFYMNRPRTVSSMCDWAEHLLWYDDGRFAHHPYFKFVVHNMIMRKRAIENSNFVVYQKLGEQHLSISELREKIQNGDNSLAKQILYFGASLRGTSQYWAQRAKELRALIQYQINDKKGLPAFFTTGSCAEYHFKPLRRLLSIYLKETSGTDVDLSDRSKLFEALQKNTHIVAKYFDLRTNDYFHDVMSPAFGVTTYWYRQEFAKSRGMVHWHGLCWRSDREPHNLINECIEKGLSDAECAATLSEWASIHFGLTGSHPAGQDENGLSIKKLWPPPEGTAPLPPEDKNPLIKLLMDVSLSQETLLEDHILLTNRFNIHRCSDYCLTSKKGKERQCRMEFGTESSPGKQLRETPAIVKDKNGSLRLEMARDHPMLVQHSRFHSQGWRANGDISLIVSKSNVDNPSVDDILATEKYVCGYACKDNQPTGAVVDLFNDLVNCADESTGATAKSLCTKLLIGTVKRDISAVEASYELSSLPLYRSSHSFQNVSLSGSRLLNKNGDGICVTKNTPLDRYLQRNEKDTSSFYDFICKSGKVPVLTGSDIEKARKHINDDNQEDDIPISSEQCEQPEWMELVQPNPLYDDNYTDFKYDNGGPEYNWCQPTYNYPPDLGVSWLQNLQSYIDTNDKKLDVPQVDVLKMNNDQKFAFNIVMKTIQNYTNKSDQFEPLRMIVSGTAGSGKSFLIKCLVKAIRNAFLSNKSVQVLCPTGNSANIISGVTLHSFLKIPTHKKGQEMKPPEGITGENLQSNCDGVKVILVDERSLIGATTLGWMEFMCRYGMQNGENFEKSWGGLPVVVFFGDDVQLPPVLDSPVFNSTSKIPASLHGVLVWNEFNCAVNLQNIVRQGNNEQQLKNVLLALREYKTTSEHAHWLQKFQWHNLKQSHGESLLKRMYANGLFVFPTHQEVWKHNKLKLIEVNTQFPFARVNAVSSGFHSKSSESDRAGGLQQTLYLCKSAKVMLSVNICVPYGLFNGAIGNFVDIIYLNEKRPDDSLPDAIMVEFHSYTGPAFIEQNPKLVPIVPVERKLDCSCNCCRRKQIPLRLGWASTIHRCQGMTIGKGEPNSYIVINPGTRAFESKTPGALFVALSRAKSAGNDKLDPDFAWHPSVFVNEDRLCHVVTTPTVKARNNEIERISRLCIQTNNKYAGLENDQGLLYFIEQSLNLTPEE
ncbi:unnamed protein product [Mytilus coruscus]|uniref:ATP-dependent DNA helicase n=1 Tax=Mytilus coruscus TaxID=42192 RepID=A0A6J8BWI3_MYTCO|nr:unnamed protein product [Mytilus coruscus]